MAGTEKTNEEKYPSVEYAYDLSLQSYDWGIRRLDAVDSTIASFTGWVTGINLALITMISSRYVANSDSISPFKSSLFWLSMVLLLLTIIYAIKIKARGELMLITPRRLYQKSLRFSKWEFKRTVIQNASYHFESNRKMVNWKHKHLNIINYLFLAEIISLALWIISLS
jgi:hypothetical protein